MVPGSSCDLSGTVAKQAAVRCCSRNGRIECAVGGVGLDRAVVRSHGAKVADGLGGAACRTHRLRRQHLVVGLSHVGVDARVSLDVLYMVHFKQPFSIPASGGC